MYALEIEILGTDLYQLLTEFDKNMSEHVFFFSKKSQSLDWHEINEKSKKNSSEKEHFSRKQFGNKLFLPFANFYRPLQKKM